MYLQRPPRKQRLINKLYGRDWFELVSGWINDGETLTQIAEKLTRAGVRVSDKTLSNWTKAQALGQQQAEKVA